MLSLYVCSICCGYPKEDNNKVLYRAWRRLGISCMEDGTHITEKDDPPPACPRKMEHGMALAMEAAGRVV